MPLYPFALIENTLDSLDEKEVKKTYKSVNKALYEQYFSTASLVHFILERGPERHVARFVGQLQQLDQKEQIKCFKKVICREERRLLNVILHNHNLFKRSRIPTGSDKDLFPSWYDVIHARPALLKLIDILKSFPSEVQFGLLENQYNIFDFLIEDKVNNGMVAMFELLESLEAKHTIQLLEKIFKSETSLGRCIEFPESTLALLNVLDTHQNQALEDQLIKTILNPQGSRVTVDSIVQYISTIKDTEKRESLIKNALKPNTLLNKLFNAHLKGLQESYDKSLARTCQLFSIFAAKRPETSDHLTMLKAVLENKSPSAEEQQAYRVC